MAELEGFQEIRKKIKKKKSTRLCVTISDDIYDRLVDHISNTGYDKSKLIEKILTMYLNKVDPKKS